jgi:hypothetical protein
MRERHGEHHVGEVKSGDEEKNRRVVFHQVQPMKLNIASMMINIARLL